MTTEQLFYTKRGKKYFKIDVKHWIKQEKNDKLIPIIRTAKSNELIDSTGLSMLHIAARCDNSTIIQLLINSECEIDAKDSYGKTALMIATAYEKVKAMELLINANADLFITDQTGQYPLKIFFGNNFFSSSILDMVFKKLKSTNIDLIEILKKFIEAGCNLLHVVHLKHAEITELFLCEQDTMKTAMEEYAILAAIENHDTDNISVLLYDGKRFEERRITFLQVFYKILRYWPYCKRSRGVIPYLIDIICNWEFLNKITVRIIGEMMKNLSMKPLHLFLTSNIYSYIKNKFGCDLLLYVFGNPDTKVIQWAQKQIFDIHSTSFEGETALHISVKCNVIENVAYLLKVGVDPNIQDEYGRTAVFNIFDKQNDLHLNEECVKLLLLYGADPQTLDNLGATVIDSVVLSNDNLNIFSEYYQSIIAHFAMIEAHNIRINSSIREYLNEIKDYHCYKSYCNQLNMMKMHEFAGHLTLFDILMANTEKICHHVDEKHYAEISEVVSKQEFSNYYNSVLIKRVRRAVLIKKLRLQAIISIEDIIPESQAYYPILRKIVSYMSDDLFVMFKKSLFKIKQELLKQ